MGAEFNSSSRPEGRKRLSVVAVSPCLPRDRGVKNSNLCINRTGISCSRGTTQLLEALSL